MLRKSIDWFLYDSRLLHERVKHTKFIYRFHANVNVDWDWQAIIYRKNFDFTQTWICNSKLHEPNKRKVAVSDFRSLILRRADFWVYEGVMVFHVLIFIFFCLEQTVKIRHGCGSYFRSAILRVTGTYVQSSFSTTTRHIGNGIWKTLYSWRFYWHGSKYELIIFWVIVMKWKWVKVPGKLSVGQKYESVLQRTLDQNDSLSSFSLKQN